MTAKWSIVLFVGALFLMACNHNKQHNGVADEAEMLPPDETVSQGVVELQTSHVSDTVTWNSRIYHYDILREPDAELPQVRDEEGGTLFADNHIDLTITCGETQVFHQRFFKSSFESFLDQNFRQNGMLEGLVFDMAVPEGLRFATSVSYPRSDLYIPLLITIDAKGGITIRKDDVLDAVAIQDDNDGV